MHTLWTIGWYMFVVPPVVANLLWLAYLVVTGIAGLVGWIWDFVGLP